MVAQTVWIFCNGERLALENVRAMLQPGDYLIAADAGLRYLRALDLIPNLVIGDLDSIDPAEQKTLAAQNVEVRRYPVHKDETDLELAVEAALAVGCRRLRIAAALGGRIDMTLSNIYLLQMAALNGLDARLEDGFEELFLIRPGTVPAQIEGQAGERVSLLPINGPAHGVTTQGLAYPLQGETLYPDRSRGISNQMLSARAQVTHAQGLLLCIHTHMLLEER
jgi:thiamine pyrophosphokinase